MKKSQNSGYRKILPTEWKTKIIFLVCSKDDLKIQLGSSEILRLIINCLFQKPSMVRNASLIEEHDSGTMQVLMSKMRKPKINSKRFTKSVGNPFANFNTFLFSFLFVLLYVVLMSFYMIVIRIFSYFCWAV